MVASSRSRPARQRPGPAGGAVCTAVRAALLDGTRSRRRQPVPLRGGEPRRPRRAHPRTRRCLVTPSPGPSDGTTATDMGSVGDRPPSRDMVRLKLLFAASGAGVGTLMPYLAVYLASRGLSATLVGLVLGLMAAVGVIMVPLWGSRGRPPARGGLGTAALLRRRIRGEPGPVG